MPSVKFDFSSRVALVTASSRGIGFAVARMLAQAGADVCICARTPESVKQAEKDLRALPNHPKILALAGDIGSDVFIRSILPELRREFGRGPDILITNSGGPPPGEILKLTDDQWLEALRRNLLSVVSLCTLAAPEMIERKFGRIVNLTSTLAKEPDKGMALSSVARAGVAAFTKTLSRELGPHGITANTILTGGCQTERFQKLVQGSLASTGETYDQAVQRISAGIPVGHVSTPEEFARIVAFFASDEASYLTGTAAAIDGGASRSVF